MKVGYCVTLLDDEAAFRRAFDSVGFRWNPAMVALLGQTVKVVTREVGGRYKPGIFGLPESEAGSGQPVWWYPFSVIYSVRELVTSPREVRAVTETCTCCLS